MKLYKNLGTALKEREDVRALKITVKGAEFPPELQNFTDLTELYLDGVCEFFPKIVPVWEKLKVLSIKWPNFKGDLSSLLSLPMLENLKIIETPMKMFLLPLGHASAPLKSLTIKDCGLPQLPEEISMLTSLEEMNLSGNALSQLPEALPALSKLKRLNLDDNLFKNFPDQIKKITTLSHLSIDRNKFSDEEKARIHREFHIWVS